MGGAVSALVNQIAIMFVLMAIGFALYKFKVIDRVGASQMASIVIYVAYPCITLKTLMVDFDFDKIVDAAFCTGITVLVLGVTALIAKVVFGKRDGVARYAVIFSNSGFIGVPIIMGVLGPEYIFYMSITSAVMTAIIWTYGVWLVSGDRSQVSLRKCVANPNMVMIAVGFICFVCSIHPPALMASVLDDLGALNTGLVMIVLGAYLAQSDLRAIATSKKAYLVSFLRLIVTPAITIAILALFSSVDLNVRLTVLIAMASPVASFAAILSEKYGGNYKFGIGLVALSTLLSLASMPLVLQVASMALS